MGCAASTPENVIDGPLPNNNQNSGDHVAVNIAEKAKETVEVCKDAKAEVPIQETSVSECEQSFKGLETVEEPIVIKADTQDMIKSFCEAESDEGIRTDCKKGYVAFEVNLDGQVEPCLDAAKKPLPKRLKVTHRLQKIYFLAFGTPPGSSQTYGRRTERKTGES